MKMTELKDKVAIVTGGSRGIGSSIALELAKNGVKIVINYNSNSEAADKMVAEIKELGVRSICSTSRCFKQRRCSKTCTSNC